MLANGKSAGTMLLTLGMLYFEVRKLLCIFPTDLLKKINWRLDHLVDDYCELVPVAVLLIGSGIAGEQLKIVVAYMNVVLCWILLSIQNWSLISVLFRLCYSNLHQSNTLDVDLKANKNSKNFVEGSMWSSGLLWLSNKEKRSFHKTYYLMSWYSILLIFPLGCWTICTARCKGGSGSIFFRRIDEAIWEQPGQDDEMSLG